MVRCEDCVWLGENIDGTATCAREENTLANRRIQIADPSAKIHCEFWEEREKPADLIEMEFNGWMAAIGHAVPHQTIEGGIYQGVEGARRLARECGCAIACGGEYWEKRANATYGGICVIGYCLRPPIDAKEWMKYLKQGMNKYREMTKNDSE